MWLIFLDEAGFTRGDWRNGIAQQPYYTLSAVCLPGARLATVYQDIRAKVTGLSLVQLPRPLGQNYEIKARDIASGTGWWQAHNTERNAVRDTMLSAPRAHDGCAFVVVVDKAAHFAKYTLPEDPYLLAFRFAFERLAQFLEEKQSYAYCVYDQNTRLQESVLEQSSALIQQGSYITGYSWFYEQHYEFVLEIERIVELAFGDSKHSLGLQIADYFATFAYQYFRNGRPAGIGWWNTLESNLHRAHGTLNGIGLKVFP